MRDNNADNDYVVHLKHWEFDYLLEDLALAYHSAQKRWLTRDKSGKLIDLTDYGLIKLLKSIGETFEKVAKTYSRT